MNEQKYPCMLICAGTSQRFGEDKMLAKLGDKPILSHVIKRVLPQVQTITINAVSNDYEIFGFPVMQDSIQGGFGPLAGILTAMEWAGTLGEKRVFTCAGDTPFLPSDWAARLAYVPDDRISVSHSGERVHNVCALWPVNLAKDLRAALENGERRVGAWIERNKFAHVPFEIRGHYDPFFNINTREDMQKAQWLAASN